MELSKRPSFKTLYYRLKIKKNTIRAVKRQLKVRKLIKNKYIRGKKIKMCVNG